jgi:hypothetical protein
MQTSQRKQPPHNGIPHAWRARVLTDEELCTKQPVLRAYQLILAIHLVSTALDLVFEPPEARTVLQNHLR